MDAASKPMLLGPPHLPGGIPTHQGASQPLTGAMQRVQVRLNSSATLAQTGLRSTGMVPPSRLAKMMTGTKDPVDFELESMVAFGRVKLSVLKSAKS